MERGHGTHQDRLIKKMRLKKISSYEVANRYLEEDYLPKHNARYAVGPAETVDFHEPVPKQMNLDDVFCQEEERKVSNDWVVQYGPRWCRRAARFWCGGRETAAFDSSGGKSSCNGES